MKKDLKIGLPEGKWQVLADGESVDLSGKGEVQGTVRVPHTTGLILIRLPS